MSFLAGALGLSGGYSSSKSQSSKTENQSGNQATATSNTYRPEQDSLQVDLANLFRALLPGMASGTLTPNVERMKTASADTINQNYASLGERANRFLASRGFGKSGAAGKAALQTELARQGDLAGNESKFAGLQLDQNNKLLSDALTAAYASVGSTANVNWSSLLNELAKGSQSGWGVGASGGASFGR